MNASIARRTRGETTVSVTDGEQACTYCGGPLDQFGYAVDHIVPLSTGGVHALSNLTVTCQPCRRAKGDPSLSKFLNWLSPLRQPLV